MRRTFAAVIATIALAAAITPSHAAAFAAVAPPGAQFTQYATPIVVYQVGGTLTFYNTDPINHDFVAAPEGNGIGPSTQHWCFLYAPGPCPIFWAPLFNVTQHPTGVSVEGLENVKAGQSYTFVCSIHANMTGTLNVIA